MGHFRNEYGQDIELERVWMKENGSTGGPLIVLFLGPRKNRTNGNPYY